MMKSPIIKRSIVIKGHKTSVSLEDAFWHDLKLIAAAKIDIVGLTVEHPHAGESFPHCGSSLQPQTHQRR